MAAAIRPQSISTEYRPISYPLQRADQVPKMCAKLAGILDRTPFFQGKGVGTADCKVIALGKWDDARICSIMSDNAARVLGDSRAWLIHNFGRGANHLFEPNGVLIQQGISLTLFEEQRRCSLSELEDAYTDLFKSVTMGWEAAEIAHHPNILFKADPERWALFIKRKGLTEESTLISAIASRLSLGTDLLQCYDMWIKHPGGAVPDKPYLWIRKTALHQVRKTLGLQLGKL